MTPFSALSLLKMGLRGQRGWQPQWRSPDPKGAYDAIIVGGGGHGLGTAYYLAREHGLTNIAVLEKGWIGGGNTGRNTTIIRSNYLFPESAALYDHAVKLWESLSQALNYNVMFSQRGVMMLAHTVHDAQVAMRHVHANRAAGVDNEWLTARAAQAFCPPLNIGDIRYPVLGAALQRRGGTARHDAVAWGYARAADALGVDIIENCEVTGIRRSADGSVEGVETTRAYISQSDKGELVIGAGTDSYTSYTQRGGPHITGDALAAICELFPTFRRMRMLRCWGGIVDVTPDRSPIIGKTGVPGLYVNCGWSTGGFKATPGSAHVFAWTIARDEPHQLNAPFTLERFRDGNLIDEAAAAAVAH